MPKRLGHHIYNTTTPKPRLCSVWSWPINLPVQFFGIFPNGVMADDATPTPWGDELEHKVSPAWPVA